MAQDTDASNLTAASASSPIPVPNELTRYFWEGANDHRLVILRCQDCGLYLHPPRPICRRCLSWSVEPEQVSGRGRVYTYTVTVTPFHPFWADKVPYVLGVVDLEEQAGLRVITNIVGCPEDSLRVGLPVRVTFSQVAPGLTLPFFEPTEAG